MRRMKASRFSPLSRGSFVQVRSEIVGWSRRYCGLLGVRLGLQLRLLLRLLRLRRRCRKAIEEDATDEGVALLAVAPRLVRPSAIGDRRVVEEVLRLLGVRRRPSLRQLPDAATPQD